MSSCACPSSALTSLTFAEGIVLVRCRAHDQQTWVVQGQVTHTDGALPALKDLFIEQRGKGGRGRTVPRKAAVRVRREAPVAPVEDRLTALLNSRGVPGTWTVS